MRRGRLVGFLTGWLIPSFRGKQSVFSPEWANAANQEDSRRIYERMYTHLSGSWVADGYHSHLISIMANDRDGIDGWHWLGFGMAAADAVRDLQPVPGCNVAYSRMVFRAPITSRVGSPRYLRSCGASPTEANE